MVFKKSLFILLSQISLLSYGLDQSRKLICGLTNNNAKILDQYDVFAQNLDDACKENKISEESLEKIIKALNFAAEKHKKQTRKDAAQTPYIIHPIGVANNVLAIGKVYDTEIIMSALLHDTVEDTDTTYEEIRQNFGGTIESYVREVSDDKALAKEERKRLQIVNASHKSDGAAIIKFADFTFNLTDLLQCAPPDWSTERVKEYFNWAQQVIDNLPKVNAFLRNNLDSIIKKFSAVK